MQRPATIVDVVAVGLGVDRLYLRSQGVQALRPRPVGGAGWPRRPRFAAPCRVRPPRLATTASRCRRRARSPASDATAGSAAAISALPSASALTGSPPASARCRSMSSWAASLSLRPPGANSFTPLSCHGLCDAETTAPATCSSTHQRATAGWAQHPDRPPLLRRGARPGARPRQDPAPKPSCRGPPRTPRPPEPRPRPGPALRRPPVSARTVCRRAPRQCRRPGSWQSRAAGVGAAAVSLRIGAEGQGHDRSLAGSSRTGIGRPGRAHGTSDRRPALSACCTAVPCVPS